MRCNTRVSPSPGRFETSRGDVYPEFSTNNDGLLTSCIFTNDASWWLYFILKNQKHKSSQYHKKIKENLCKILEIEFRYMIETQ